MNIWQELGIEPTRNLQDIKLAYAKRLKQVHPENDPDGFQRLRAAYEQAQRLTASPAPRLPGIDVQVPSSAIPAPIGLEAGSTISAAPVTPAESASLPPARQQDFAAELGTPTRPAVLLQRLPPPAQAAEALCEQLLKLPERERTDAIRPWMRQAALEQLDYQAALQRAVAQLLSSRFEALLPLIANFANHYGWIANASVRQPIDPIVGVLLGRWDARRWRQAIDDELGLKQHLRAALRLLSSGVDEPAFKKFAARSRNLKEMRELLAELHDERKHALRYEVNSASVRWWLAYLNTQPVTRDDYLRLLGLGVITGPILVLIAIGTLEAITGFDLLNHWILSGPLLLLSPGIFVAFRALSRRLHRSKVFEGFGRRWQSLQKRRRRIISSRTWRLFVVGWIVGPVTTVFLAMVLGFAGYDLFERPSLLVSLLLASTGILIVSSYLIQRARRWEFPARLIRLQSRWQNWRRVRAVRITVWSLSVVTIILSVWAETLPGFWLFPILALLLYWFLNSISALIVAAAVVAWPLQIPLSMLVSATLDRFPKLFIGFDSAPVILFPHLIATFLVGPLSSSCERFYKHTRGQSLKDPEKFSFYVALSIAALSLFAMLFAHHGDATVAVAPTPVNRSAQINSTTTSDAASGIRVPPSKPMARTVDFARQVNALVSENIQYPRSALRRGEEGLARVRLKITTSGEIIGAQLVGSSGHPDLDAEAIDVWNRIERSGRKLQMSQSTPGASGDYYIEIPISFKLND